MEKILCVLWCLLCAGVVNAQVPLEYSHQYLQRQIFNSASKEKVIHFDADETRTWIGMATKAIKTIKEPKVRSKGPVKSKGPHSKRWQITYSELEQTKIEGSLVSIVLVSPNDRNTTHNIKGNRVVIKTDEKELEFQRDTLDKDSQKYLDAQEATRKKQMKEFNETK
jgi:hypothetical protein